VIDEKNQFVLLEPAVTFCQMHGQTLKRGLIGCMPGGGGGVSVLANAFVNGMGLFNYRISYAAQRRWNGIEWVTPEGEIYRFGSLANGDDDWYWGDGIGPNISGLLHGVTAWSGAMGIVTRISTRLYPFQPEPMEPEGISYDSCVTFPEGRVKWVNASYDNEASLEKSILEIGRAKIGFIVNRVPAFWREIARTRGDNDYRNTFWDLWNKRTNEQVSGLRILRVCLVGRASKEQLDYEERVLHDIIAENGGQLRAARQNDEASFFAVNSVGMWQPTGMFGEGDGGIESMPANREARRQWIELVRAPEFNEDFLDCKDDSPWYLTFSLGRMFYSEFHPWPDAIQYDLEDPKYKDGITDKFMRWRVSEAGKVLLNTGLQSFLTTLVTPIRVVSPAFQDYDSWLDRFMREFNPKGLSAPGQPYIHDRIVDDMYPDSVTDELKGIVAKIAAGPWNGNPD